MAQHPLRALGRAALTMLIAAAPLGAEKPRAHVSSARVDAYRGTSTLTQEIGGERDEFRYTARVLHLAAAAPATGERPLRVVRYLVDPADGEEMGTIDDYAIDESSGAVSLRRTRREPFEMDGKTHMVEVYLPAVTVPAFALPEPGSRRAAKTELSILNLGRVETELVTQTERDGDRVVVRRTLPEAAKVGFDFRGTPALVSRYEERYDFDGKGEVTRIEQRTAFGFTPPGGDTARLERVLTLERESSAPLAGAGAPAWTVLLADAAAIERALDGRRPSGEMRPLVEKLVAKSADTPLAPLGRALAVRLQAFAGFFETTAEGKILAHVLGREAPDFKLSDLAGDDYAFRTRTRGKVTLLSFWGYG